MHTREDTGCPLLNALPVGWGLAWVPWGPQMLKVWWTVSCVTRWQAGVQIGDLESDNHLLGFPGGASDKEPACQCRRCKRQGFNPWVRKIPWRRARQPIPVFLPGESHELRSLAGYSPWNCKESDMTEATWHTHFYL